MAEPVQEKNLRPQGKSSVTGEDHRQTGLVPERRSFSQSTDNMRIIMFPLEQILQSDKGHSADHTEQDARLCSETEAAPGTRKQPVGYKPCPVFDQPKSRLFPHHIH